MGRRRWCGLVGLFLVGTSGCASRIYFTQPLRDRFELGLAKDAEGEPIPSNASELQYFASRKIELLHAVSSRDEGIAGGRIVVRNGRMLEQILIRRGTPGVATAWGPDWIEVSFEKGSSLRFVRGGSERADEEGAPELATPGRDDSGDYRLETIPAHGQFKERVMFEGRAWRLGSGTSGARLRVKRRAMSRQRKARRVLRGRRL